GGRGVGGGHQSGNAGGKVPATDRVVGSLEVAAGALTGNSALQARGEARKPHSFHSSHPDNDPKNEHVRKLEHQRKLAGIDGASNTGAYTVPLPGGDPQWWDNHPGRGSHKEQSDGEVAPQERVKGALEMAAGKIARKPEMVERGRGRAVCVLHRSGPEAEK
ncbi:hypothetical protein EIP91_009718, partial [Steccherinum ochraceum]